MPPGPRPTPTHLKILKGNPGRRPLNLREPTPRNHRPSCPTWLSADAKKEWRRIVAEIDAMRILASSDRDLLVVLVSAVVSHRKAVELVERAGILIKSRDGGLVKNPACQIARDMGMVVMRCAEHFGLSPSARSRISMPKADEDAIARRYLS